MKFYSILLLMLYALSFNIASATSQKPNLNHNSKEFFENLDAVYKEIEPRKLRIKKGIVQKILHYKDESGKNLLHKAVEKGNLKLIKRLIKKGIDIYTQDNEGNTPLHRSVSLYDLKDQQSIQEKIITILLDQERKLNRIAFFSSIGNICGIQNNKGHDPIDIAIELYKSKPITLNLFKIFKKHLVAQNKKYIFFNKKDFQYSALGKKALIVKIETFLNNNNLTLENEPPQLRIKTHPLHQAVDQYKLYVLNNHIIQGVNIYHKNERGETALHRAISLYGIIPNQTETLKLIIQALLEEEQVLNKKRTFFTIKNLIAERNNNDLDVIDILIGKCQASLNSNTHFDNNIFSILLQHLKNQNKTYTLFNGEQLIKKIEKYIKSTKQKEHYEK